MNIIFLGYRSWAINTFKICANHKKIKKKKIFKTIKQLDKINLSNYDLLVTLGWSNEINKSVITKIKTIGLHCASKDRYSYGSPIQNQIIDGLVKTKHRVFLWKYKKNSKRAHTHTREYTHETDLSLKGSMAEIFLRLEKTSIQLINNFLDDFPDKIKIKKWKKENMIRKKRTSYDSKIKKEIFFKDDLKFAYNTIRSLGDPYPNAFIEDKFGKLYFKKVKYEKN